MDLLAQPAPRSAGALLLSAAIHSAVIGVVAMASLSPSTLGVFSWQQLEGQSESRTGSNALVEILGAPDAVRIVVSPTRAGDGTQGLAWWSPSRGLWFAIDGAPPPARERAFVLWLHLPGQPPISPGVIDIHADGSGRMVSRGDLSSMTPRAGVVTLSAGINGIALSGGIDASQLR
jgi:hypothetical protein